MPQRTAPLHWLAAVLCLAGGFGCSDKRDAGPPRDSGPGIDAGPWDGGGGGDVDAGGGDSGLDYRDARPVDPCLPSCGPTELCGMDGMGDGDGLDNNCNLVNDDGLAGCSSTLTCPGSERASPLTRHLLRGSAIYTGSPMSWHWTVECPGTVGTCPAPTDPNAGDTEIFFVSSGNYRVRLEIRL